MDRRTLDVLSHCQDVSHYRKSPRAGIPRCISLTSGWGLYTFLRILEKAVALISTNCWSLLRSLLKRRKASSKITYFDESLEMGMGCDWSDLFFSRRVVRRNFSSASFWR